MYQRLLNLVILPLIRRRIVLIVLFLFCAFSSRSQDFNNELAPKKPTFASPEAQAITKFIDQPVDFKTGLPEISVPIFNLINNDISVPIALKYNSGGIKVRDVATSVGLGWSLNAGGVINYIVNSKPDGGFVGFSNYQSILDYIGSTVFSAPNSPLNSADYERIYSEEHDPDYYLYTYPGGAGKFIKTGSNLTNYSTIPSQNVLIAGGGAAFKITDANGLIYDFEAVERQKIENTCPSGDLFGAFENVKFAYYLTKITSPTGRHIEFQYKTYVYTYYDDVSMSKSEQVVHAPASSTCWSKVSILEGKVVQKIISDNGYTIDFLYDPNPRLDLPTGNTLGKLNSIEVEFNNELIKKFTLNHQLVFCTQLPFLTLTPPDFENVAHRLLLSEVKEEGIGKYNFSYNLNHTPSRFHFGVDHWGYYNGKSNSTLIPSGVRGLGYMDGADREASEEHMQAFLLTKVSYPTGGETFYHYEANKDQVAALGTEYKFPQPQVTVNSTGNNSVERIFDIPAGAENVKVYYWSNSSNTTQITPVANEPFSRAQIFRHNNLVNEEFPLFTFSGQGSQSNHLTTNLVTPNQTYRVIIQTNGIVGSGGDAQVASTTVKITWLERIPTNQTVTHFYGGMRIKSIGNNSIANTLNAPKFFVYRNLTSQGYPVVYDYYTYFREMGSNPVSIMRRGSSSIQPTRVYYREVEVFEQMLGGLPKGKSVYHYSPEPFYKHFTVGTQLYAESDLRWAGGDLEREDHYRYESANGSYGLVQSKVYHYQTNQSSSISFYSDGDKPWERQVFGVKSSLVMDESGIMPAIYSIEVYKHKTAFKYLSNITTVEYENGQARKHDYRTNYFNLETTFLQKEFQSASMAVTSTTSAAGYDGVNAKEYRRVADFSSGINPIIDGLKTKNMLQNIIEKRDFKILDGTWFTGGIMIDYYPTLYTIKAISMAELARPILVNKDLFSESSFTLNSLQQPGYFEFYKPQEEYNYDLKFNLIQIHRPQGIYFKSYLYGYQKALPVAVIENASVDRIFYEGFEDTGTNSSANSPAKTGDRFLNTGVYDFANNGFLPSNTVGLKLSYWYWQGNEWKFSGVLPFMPVINQGTRLDDIRVFPEGALMKTYTHKPGWGISSETDPNNLTTKFEYDNAGRLKHVIDFDDNLLKLFQYNLVNK